MDAHRQTIKSDRVSNSIFREKLENFKHDKIVFSRATGTEIADAAYKNGWTLHTLCTNADNMIDDHNERTQSEIIL